MVEIQTIFEFDVQRLMAHQSLPSEFTLHMVG